MSHSAETKRSVPAGVASGLLAGAAASGLMDLYWGLVQNVPGARPEQKPRGSEGREQRGEPSTQAIADHITEAVTGHDVPEDKKAAAGVGVHYATGIGFGGLYGAAAARSTGMGLVAGLAYGAAIWLFLDEIALRVLKIGPPAEKVPLDQHLQALGAHFIYGASTALVTRLLLRLSR